MIGQWSDSEGGLWKVMRFTDFDDGYFDSKKKDTLDMNEKTIEFYHLRKKFYMVEYEKKTYTFNNTETMEPIMDAVYFQAVPFKINQQLFLDFTPHHEGSSTNKSTPIMFMPWPSNNTVHKIDTHSLAKLDIDSKNQLTITWLSEEKIIALLDSHKLNIKHEKNAFDGKMLLTATSEELVKFISKYMKSEDRDKWQTHVEFNLKRK